MRTDAGFIERATVRFKIGVVTIRGGRADRHAGCRRRHRDQRRGNQRRDRCGDPDPTGGAEHLPATDGAEVVGRPNQQVCRVQPAEG